MNVTYTKEEIILALDSCQKHIVEIKTPITVDGDLDCTIKTVESKSFLHNLEQIHKKYKNKIIVGNKISFMIDTESYVGVIKEINNDTIHVLTDIGLITNIPISETYNNISNMNDIIKVEDRLPDVEHGSYLVYSPTKFPKSSRWLVAEYYDDVKGFYSESSECFLDDVTHWCELPKDPF